MSRDEYLDLFLSESKEILDALNSALVKLEKNAADKECLNDIFRNAHNLKGIAATMGYEDITKLAHEMENVLELLRQGRMEADKDTMDSLFQWCDALEKKVEGIRKMTGKINPNANKETPAPSAPSVVEVPLEKIDVQTVRVRMDQLDHLMNTVGELVINKARFVQAGQSIEDRPLREALIHLERLTGELQNEMMQVRLVPIDYIFNRFPRMIRDLSTKEKKEVDLVIEGAEIGLDRTILDEINEPLVHLLRNAVHHGLETPEERLRDGKPARGTIRLCAFRQRHFVVIEVSDDGRGMNDQEIRDLAVAKKILSEEEAEKLSVEEALTLITSPAFSTSEAVTQTSGRGFGMNAVKTIVESFGGSLKIETDTHKGSRFILTLPLSLAIVQALLVEVSGQIYAIPLSNIVETIKIEKKIIRRIANDEMIPYRDTVLPLIRLSEQFGLEPAASNGSRIPLIVVETGHRKAGFVVDELVGQQEIVIKSLQGVIKNVRGIAGATILGSGKVAMIVDIASLLLEPFISKQESKNGH